MTRGRCRLRRVRLAMVHPERRGGGSAATPPSPRRTSGRSARRPQSTAFLHPQRSFTLRPLGDGLASSTFLGTTVLVTHPRRGAANYPEKVAEAQKRHPPSAAPLPLPSIVGRNAVGDTAASDPRHVLDASPNSYRRARARAGDHGCGGCR